MMFGKRVLPDPLGCARPRANNKTVQSTPSRRRGPKANIEAVSALRMTGDVWLWTDRSVWQNTVSDAHRNNSSRAEGSFPACGRALNGAPRSPRAYRYLLGNERDKLDQIWKMISQRDRRDSARSQIYLGPTTDKVGQVSGNLPLNFTGK